MKSYCQTGDTNGQLKIEPRQSGESQSYAELVDDIHILVLVSESTLMERASTGDYKKSIQL